MSPERHNLAEAFQPARGRSLEGLLAPKRKKDAEDAQPRKPAMEPSTPPSKAEQQETPISAKTAGNEPDVAPAQAIDGSTRNVGVYLSPELLAEVKGRARSEQITYADLLVDAFEAIAPADLTREFFQPTEQSVSGMPRRVRRARGTAGIQIQLRLDDRQIQWLDEQVTNHSAPSRSALVSTAFRLYLST
ncbi:hypothetical protein IWX75_003215 [Arthrobacter sp. CAN_A6]|uniref:ribbon-helix-helix domain-containing protein n=1 Tax=Arthrobacter sp. CAN_A6 TaxID=2787721 RepID=UPI0018CBA412